MACCGDAVADADALCTKHPEAWRVRERWVTGVMAHHMHWQQRHTHTHKHTPSIISVYLNVCTIEWLLCWQRRHAHSAYEIQPERWSALLRCFGIPPSDQPSQSGCVLNWCARGNGLYICASVSKQGVSAHATLQTSPTVPTHLHTLRCTLSTNKYTAVLYVIWMGVINLMLSINVIALLPSRYRLIHKFTNCRSNEYFAVDSTFLCPTLWLLCQCGFCETIALPTMAATLRSNVPFNTEPRQPPYHIDTARQCTRGNIAVWPNLCVFHNRLLQWHGIMIGQWNWYDLVVVLRSKRCVINHISRVKPKAIAYYRWRHTIRGEISV